MVWIHVYGSLCMQEVRAYMLYSKLSLQIVCSKWEKKSSHLEHGTVLFAMLTTVQNHA